MKKLAVVLVVLLSSTLFSSSKNVSKNREVSDVNDQLISIVTSILEGKDYSELKSCILPEAYLISDDTYESIIEVLTNRDKQSILVEGNTTKINFYSLRIPDGINGAYLVLETKSLDDEKTNWHSIFFTKNENNEWQILGWHKS